VVPFAGRSPVARALSSQVRPRFGHTEKVDARPSDAILLAARTRAPIVVNEGVLDQAGLLPDALTEKLEAETPGKVVFAPCAEPELAYC
jgi:hypothetical protein